MRLTRRELAAALAAAGALAQTPAPSPASPEAELQRARDQVKAMVARLASLKVPMTVEPSFQFKA